MTTTVSIHVGGHYKAVVTKNGGTPFEVHGDYEGSPNPGGNWSDHIPHPAEATITVKEEYLGQPWAPPKRNEAD